MKSVKTFVWLWFSSEGANPSDIGDRLTSMGFKPGKGFYDYVYYWRTKPDVMDLVELAKKVQLTLRGTNVFYKLETVGLE